MNARPLALTLGLLAMAVAVVVTTGPSAVRAQLPQPVVTIAPGPTTQESFITECSDAVSIVNVATSFLLTRSGPAGDPLTISYLTEGTAEPGVHYQPLPRKATFPAGAKQTSIDVTLLHAEQTQLVELSLQLVEGDDYDVGNPGAATIQFISKRDPSLARVVCGFAFSSDESNIYQAIMVGQGLKPFTLTSSIIPSGYLVPATGVFELISGKQPEGISLNADGTFSGTASAPGNFIATIRACSSAQRGASCDTTMLNVVVTARELPATGAPALSFATFAIGLLICGAIARLGGHLLLQRNRQRDRDCGRLF